MCNCKCSPEATSDTRQQPAFVEPSYNLSFGIAFLLVIVGGAVVFCGMFADSSTMYTTGFGIMGLGLIWTLGVATAAGEANRFNKTRYGPDAKPEKSAK